MVYEERSDRVGEIEDLYAGYTVYDMRYEKIGKVDDLFVKDRNRGGVAPAHRGPALSSEPRTIPPGTRSFVSRRG